MKFLIVGAGMIGETHARIIKRMGKDIALCDNLPKNVDYLGDLFDIKERYTDYKVAVKSADADAVIVCTPNHLHAPVAILSMENGCHVLCEKPLAATIEQAKAILEASEKTECKLMVGYIIRATEALESAKKVLASGALGKIVSARCILASPETLDVAKTQYRRSYETGGGIIYDYTHEIDYCRYLFGEPESAFAYCGSYLRKTESIDDSADILMQFKRDMVLYLHMDYIQRVGRVGCSRSFEVVCEKGVLSCDFKSMQIDWNDGRREEYNFDFDWDNNFQRQMERFIALCNGEDVPHASGLDGLRAIEIADALYHSVREHKMISF